jgi:CDP-diacylglycerol---glycerol-3-phosphate 3-phosphatidyltransferase
MPPRRLNLPNAISLGRIAVCPVIFILAFSTSSFWLFAAFILFVVAAVSDLWDGYLARKHGLITDMGKLLDPLADKLLLVATLIPFYVVSRQAGAVGPLPWWGELPMWVLIVIFGRELAVTLFRSYAARRGEIISAGGAGKVKAFVQNLFIGSVFLWYALATVAENRGWNGAVWSGWSQFHGAFVGLSLTIAILLTVYSMLLYFWRYRLVMAR